MKRLNFNIEGCRGATGLHVQTLRLRVENPRNANIEIQASGSLLPYGLRLELDFRVI